MQALQQMIEEQFSVYCADRELALALSYQMPPGYEDAYGTVDVLSATLHLNLHLLKERPAYEGMYHCYHELRHAMQYQNPMDFPPAIRRSLPYVILYNGLCYKLSNGAWQQIKLEGEQEYFTRAYQNLPYETDAHQFAVAQTLADFPDDGFKIRQLADFFLPKAGFPQAEYETLFARIDAAINKENPAGKL